MLPGAERSVDANALAGHGVHADVAHSLLRGERREVLRQPDDQVLRDPGVLPEVVDLEGLLHLDAVVLHLGVDDRLRDDERRLDRLDHGIDVEDGAHAGPLGHAERHHREGGSFGDHHRAVCHGASGLELIEAGDAFIVRRHRQALAALSLGDGVVEYTERDVRVRERVPRGVDDVDLERADGQRRIVHRAVLGRLEHVVTAPVTAMAMRVRGMRVRGAAVVVVAVAVTHHGVGGLCRVGRGGVGGRGGAGRRCRGRRSRGRGPVAPVGGGDGRERQQQREGRYEQPSLHRDASKSASRSITRHRIPRSWRRPP